MSRETRDDERTTYIPEFLPMCARIIRKEKEENLQHPQLHVHSLRDTIAQGGHHIRDRGHRDGLERYKSV